MPSECGASKDLKRTESSQTRNVTAFQAPTRNSPNASGIRDVGVRVLVVRMTIDIIFRIWWSMNDWP